MQHNINVEFTSTIDKTIYEKSVWNTKEEFFEKIILPHVDTDLKLFKREVKNMKGKQKAGYETVIQTLSEMKQSMYDTIKYEVLSEENNIENLKVSFHFKYYPTDIMTAQKTVELFIFTTPIQDIKITSESFENLKKIPGRIPEEEKEKVDNAISLFHAVVEFMENAKSNVLVTKDGVELKGIFSDVVKKHKM